MSLGALVGYSASDSDDDVNVTADADASTVSPVVSSQAATSKINLTHPNADAMV